MPDVRSTWMRGGTSKCWVFERSALDLPGWDLDALLLRLYGSPDARQLDGVGGGTSTTSKAVILQRSATPGIDVDYTFAQVGTEQAKVDWGSNCGNCSSVVGLYALRHGWVPAAEEAPTTVRVCNTNTGQLIEQQVGPVGPDGSARVEMWFVDPAGRTTGALFPTGSPVDVLTGPDGDVEVTLVDAGAPVVVVPAPAVGLTGTESPADIDRRPDLLRRLEGLRRAAAVRFGLADDPAGAQRAVPKLALVGGPVDRGDRDLDVRMMSMGRTHPALAVTGSVALTMAGRQPGTVVSRLIGRAAGQDGDAGAGSTLRLGTPAGVLTTLTRTVDGRPAVGVHRSARRLAEASIDVAPADAARTDEEVRS